MPKKEGFSLITTVNDALEQVVLPSQVKWLVKPTFWMMLFLGVMGSVVQFGVEGGTEMTQFIIGQLGDAGVGIWGALVGIKDAAVSIWGAIFGGGISAAEAAVIPIPETFTTVPELVEKVTAVISEVAEVVIGSEVEVSVQSLEPIHTGIGD